MMKQHRLKLLTKNIWWRIILCGFFLIVGNLPFVIKPQSEDLTVVLWFNLLMSAILLILNIFDILLMICCKKSFNKFTKWLFINKFFSWQKIKGAKHLATTKQNRFLVKSKNFWAMPLWSSFIEIPIGILIVLFPLLVFAITTIFNDGYNRINGMIIYGSIISLQIIINNIWLKNCNDGFKNNNKSYEMIQNAINQIVIDNQIIHKTREIWTRGIVKAIIMFLSSALMIFSIIGFVVASLTLFAKIPAHESYYPYFHEWKLWLFEIMPWQNTLIIAAIAWVTLIWFVNICVFITTPWSLLIMWKKSYLIWNLLFLNFIVILFWGVRFNDEEKIALINNEKAIANDEQEETVYATTSSIIEQVNNNQEIEIHDEQIVTRVVPLDPFDENK